MNGPREIEAPEPDEVERLAEDLVRVPVRTATLAPATRTNAFWVQDGRGWWLVDPGADDEEALAAYRAGLDAVGGSEGSVQGVLLTHHHPDHVGGVRLLARREGWPVCAHPASPLRERWPGLPWVTPDASGRLGELRVRWTPGHASDHWVVETPLGGWLMGDVVTGLGTVVIAPPDASMGAYLRTLEGCLEAMPARVHPAHGQTIAEAHAHVERLIAHRLGREALVLRALTQEGQPIDAVTRQAYAELAPRFWPLAALSTLAHLEKLGEEGRASRDEAGRWRRGNDGA